MRKADRLFQLTNLIRSRQPVKAEVLAEELGVSVRSIYRYIDDLSVSGIPIYGTTGLGYQLDEKFELPPLTLTEQELASLMLGVGMVTSWTGDNLSQSAKSLLAKIESVLPKKILNNYNNVIFSPTIFSASDDRKIQRDLWEQLHTAIKQSKIIQINYQSLKEEYSQRELYPLGLFYWGAKWTLAAWCVAKDDFRNFRVDRIEDLTVLDSQFTKTSTINLKNFIKKAKQNSNSN